MARTQRVTLETISSELGLSTSSVSRALRNDPLIHPETRARVNAMATRLGYQGRSRRGPRKESKQRSIRAIFAAHSLTDVKAYVNMMAYMQGMTSEADTAGLMLSVHATPPGNGAAGARDLSQTLEAESGDALILSGRHDPEFVKRLAEKYQVISIVRTYDEVKHDLVSPDNMSGISSLVARLAEHGHRKLAWISNEESSYYSHMRRAGFLDRCLSSGLALSEQELTTGFFENDAVKDPEPVLELVRRGVTGFVASSDHAAFEIWKILSSHGIDVPGAVSVTGFDSVGESGHDCPTFTSFDPGFVEIGRASVRLALWRWDNPTTPPLRVIVGGRLVEGETLGPVAGSAG